MMSLPALASVANTGLYVALGGVAANGLMASVPRLVAGEQFTNAQYGGKRRLVQMAFANGLTCTCVCLALVRRPCHQQHLFPGRRQLPA